ncbi:MAG TPA: histone deacetylase [Kofleriaceae bacterium]|nr:histone deacetylase [Kofleriaceae bacterium]
MNVFYADHHVVPLPAGHRFPMGKYAALRRELVDRGVVPAGDFIEAPLVSHADLVRVHDEDYVDAFIAGRVSDKIMREIGLPWSRELVLRTLASAGGTVAATREARSTGIGANLAGGTHHARRDRGSGFCVFNDLAIAAAYALVNGVQRVLVFDADVHQGDGTAAIFAEQPRVFTCSIHGARNFPFRKETSDLDVELADNTGDEPYLATIRGTWETAMSRSNPELVLYQAGVDPLGDDKLGRLAVTAAGLEQRDRFVLGAAKSAGIPIVLTLGGGYANPIESSIDAHIGTYRAAREIYSS